MKKKKELQLRLYNKDGNLLGTIDYLTAGRSANSFPPIYVIYKKKKYFLTEAQVQKDREYCYVPDTVLGSIDHVHIEQELSKK